MCSIKYVLFLDDSIFKYFVGVYVGNYFLMFKSKEFIGGIINGVYW